MLIGGVLSCTAVPSLPSKSHPIDIHDGVYRPLMSQYTRALPYHLHKMRLGLPVIVLVYARLHVALPIFF